MKTTTKKGLLLKPIQNFEDRYSIYEDGTVISHKSKNKEVKHFVTKQGYHTVVLWGGDKYYRRYIHRLVGQAFLDNPANLPHIDHLDNDKSNNSVENIEWVSHKENTRRAIADGLYKRDKYGRFC